MSFRYLGRLKDQQHVLHSAPRLLLGFHATSPVAPASSGRAHRRKAARGAAPPEITEEAPVTRQREGQSMTAFGEMVLKEVIELKQVM